MLWFCHAPIWTNHLPQVNVGSTLNCIDYKDTNVYNSHEFSAIKINWIPAQIESYLFDTFTTCLISYFMKPTHFSIACNISGVHVAVRRLSGMSGAMLSSTEGMELYLGPNVVQSIFVWTSSMATTAPHLPPSCSLQSFPITRVKCMLTFFFLPWFLASMNHTVPFYYT